MNDVTTIVQFVNEDHPKSPIATMPMTVLPRIGEVVSITTPKGLLYQGEVTSVDWHIALDDVGNHLATDATVSLEGDF